jgi:hypothetical protein
LNGLLREIIGEASAMYTYEYGATGWCGSMGEAPHTAGLDFGWSGPQSGDMKIRSIIAVSAVAFSSLLVIAAPAEAATRVKFKRGSYCGTYTGNFRGGKTFVLGLDEGQKFSTRNIGNGTNTNFYVTGPSGELSPNREDRSTLYYYTESQGDHFIKITSTVRTASVEFCAF